MAIRCRPMRHEDIPDCVKIVGSHPVLAPRYGETIALVPEAWSLLLNQQAFNGVIFEEPHGKAFRKVGLGARAFLSDAYMAKMKKAPFFWVGPDLAKCIVKGQSPLLTDRELRQANLSGGLNLFVWDGAASADDLGRTKVMNSLFVEFIDQHRGFLLKELIAQSSSPDMLEAQLKSGGFLLGKDGRYKRTVREKLDAVIKTPHFVGVTRELALQQFGTWVSSLFVYEPPKFGFRTSEQRLLLAALEARTDEQIAEKLEISLSTVKKTWRQIYERVAEFDSELILDLHSEGGRPERGKTKKQRLLAYLREHMQEVRPFASRM